MKYLLRLKEKIYNNYKKWWKAKLPFKKNKNKNRFRKKSFLQNIMKISF
jgi:hypothetical protein